MDIRIKGASENNLKQIDARFGDGLTVVTGVSGSGKTSLVFDTVYHEAHRRFLDVFLYGRGGERLAPASVESITGLGPTIAVGQNLLNRNPISTVASASGLHPFFRLLFTHYGVRHCLNCGRPLSVLTEDEIVERLGSFSKQEPSGLYAPLVSGVTGSHKTLLSVLSKTFGRERLVIDGKAWNGRSLAPSKTHSIEIEMGMIDKTVSLRAVRDLVQQVMALGAGAVRIRSREEQETLVTTLRCSECDSGLEDLRPTHFSRPCPFCKAKGCERCDSTGMHPQAASVRWEAMRLPDLLARSVEDTRELFANVYLPSTADRLRMEIQRRLDALEKVGLGYLSLNRSAPSLSRGEAQRVRLAISLSSRLEDMLHVLDEPTIGQHPADINRFLPAFRELAGPVIYVEHDRVAAASADHAIDMGSGAGREGGEIIFTGSPRGLWRRNSPTGRYFSLRDQVMTPEPRPAPEEFLVVKQAHAHNLKKVDVKIPVNRLTVITGVSGSGKSSLVEHVLLPTINGKTPVACSGIEGPKLKPTIVDQSPIGRNPRSNPATYTKLSDAIRDLFARATGLSKSYFSFNRPEGACESCKGTGATEVAMRFLPSIWIPCSACSGQRFNEEALAATVELGGSDVSIADLYALPIQEVGDLLRNVPGFSTSGRKNAQSILNAFIDVGLGYLQLGQPSTTLSGGEAQRVKLTKYLGRNTLGKQLLILDEPSTGLHPRDLDGLLLVLDRLVRNGATIVIVEHNTDFMRAADWIVDLGPGAGPKGGHRVYQGPPSGILKVKSSLTGEALKRESDVQPRKPAKKRTERGPAIRIRNARANNLKGIDVDIPKGTLTVVTGVSGSGKSSLVKNVLETEARRRYLESLSMFERQGVREGAHSPVDSISGLGVVLTVAPHRAHLWSQLPQFTRRNSVGAITELRFHISNILASMGERKCLQCGSGMKRETRWVCPKCGQTAPIAKAAHFSGSHYASACRECNGIGTQQMAQPEKLIVNPDMPLCAGAMYSPGYWPKTYLCKDNPVIPAIGKRHGFDPFLTPWKEMTEEAQNAFLYGDGFTYTYTYISKSTGKLKGKELPGRSTWHGFYRPGGELAGWDVHGTYTRRTPCGRCDGSGFQPEFLAVTLLGKNIFELSEMPLVELEALVKRVPPPASDLPMVETGLEVMERRLRFLRQVGIGYLNLNRPTGTLSAGEAQRVQLASLLGSGLTFLTILVDEPSRGMHPSELEALRDALLELRDGGNTVIVVEHDLLMIRAADHVIDMGPGAGSLGGSVVAKGKPEDIARAKTVTGKWLQDEDIRPLSPEKSPPRRKARDWMVLKGARENNLRGETVRFPLGTLIGVCGVSGSGKSTLLIDTVGRILVKRTHTSSMAQEPVDPGDYDSIENTPPKTFTIDQSRRAIRQPASFLGLVKPLLKVYEASDDARALGLDERGLAARCTACGGGGWIRIDMGFLPDEFVECETCKKTGYRPEAWEIRIRGVALPEVNAMTLDDVYEHFKEEKRITAPLKVVRQVGLGYLVWSQPATTLSGGEAQRLKIAKELYKKPKGSTLYILDEPTLGLHMADVARLVEVLNHLVDAGHTVVVVEHHPHVLAACDWLIELGPGGGPEGGKIVAAGTPEDVVKKDTPTGPYLLPLLGATG